VSFLAPIWLAAAGAAALGVVTLHFITTQRPAASPLPTARFVPDGDARAASRAARPTDLLLLLLRCAAVLLLGTAFAGPVVAAARAKLARVIIVDRSRAALSDVRDSALAVWHEGGAGGRADAVIVFDSAATETADGADDSLRALAATARRGSLTAALVSARRAAGALSLRADSIELVIVSPLTTDELDAASAPTIARWPGRVRLVRTAAAPQRAAAVTLAHDSPDDPLRPLVAALGAVAPAGTAARAVVRVVRGGLSPADSAVARSGAAVVSWPLAGGVAATVQGVWAGTATLVAPLTRIALPAGGRVIARWADGAPAATETSLGRGCVRGVGIGVPSAGDVSLQPAFMSVARVLIAPCGASSAVRAAPDSVARGFARAGAAAPAASLRGADDRSPAAPWLLAAALLLLAGETFVRRGAARAEAAAR